MSTSDTSAPPILRLPSPLIIMPPSESRPGMIFGTLGTKSLVALRNERSVRARKLTVAKTDGPLVNGLAVQFDKVDQHQPVRWLTTVLSFSKKSTLLRQRDARAELGPPIPHRKASRGGFSKIGFQPLFVTKLESVTNVFGFEYQYRFASDHDCKSRGNQIGHFDLPSVHLNRAWWVFFIA
jgi:hypothetical protein